MDGWAIGFSQQLVAVGSQYLHLQNGIAANTVPPSPTVRSLWHRTPRFKKRRLHGELVQRKGGIVHKYPQNQSYAGSSGQPRTTNDDNGLLTGLCGVSTLATKSSLCKAR